MIKKIYIGIILFFGFMVSVSAHDQTYLYDFSALGDLSDPIYTLPYNLTDFTVNEQADVTVIYNGYDCDLQDDFLVYIDWTWFNVSCGWGNSGDTNIEVGTINLAPWTYSLYVDENRDNYFEIRELYVYVDYTDWILWGTWALFYDGGYKTIGFFDSYLEFLDFAEESTIMYLICLFVLMIWFWWIRVKNDIL